MKTKDQLIIEKQDELIKFYGKYISDTAVFLQIHNAGPCKEDIDIGKRLRQELEALKQEAKETQCHAIYEKVKEAWTPDINTPFLGNSGAVIPKTGYLTHSDKWK